MEVDEAAVHTAITVTQIDPSAIELTQHGTQPRH